MREFLYLLALGTLLRASGELIDIPLWTQVPFQQANAGEPVTRNGGGVSNVHTPKLVKFEDEETRKKGVYYKNNLSIVVMPGGAYSFLSTQNEGLSVCNFLNSLGLRAYMLLYRHKPYTHPIPLIDAFRAVRLVRKAGEGGAVGIMGFSAGGHLAASVLTFASLHPTLFLNQSGAGDMGKASGSTEWLSSEGTDNLAKLFSCRPDFTVLFYPVISMVSGLRHDKSRENIAGSAAGSPMSALDGLMSLEKSVKLNADAGNLNGAITSPKMGPVLLIHSADDQVVGVDNSLEFLKALLSLNTGVNRGYRSGDRTEVDAEMRIYSDGNHGYGLRRKDRVVPGWYTEGGVFREWLDRKLSFISQ